MNKKKTPGTGYQKMSFSIKTNVFFVSNYCESFPIFILPQDKFLQFDWLRAVAFLLNLKYLHVKITNLLRVVV